MMVFKNVTGQTITVFAFNSTTNAPVTGDAANLTAYVSKDDAALSALTDTSAAEIDATNAKGYYRFDLGQSETNADKLLFSCKSATSNVVVICIPDVAYTSPNLNTVLPTVAPGAANGLFIAGTNAATTVTTAFTTTFTGDLTGSVGSVTGDIGGNINGNVAGNVLGTVDAIVSSVGVSSIDAGAINAAAFASGALDAVWSTAARTLTAGTNIVLAKGTGITGFNDLSAAAVNAEVDTALADYDPPTNAEMVARTLAAADYATATNLATVDTVVDAVKVVTDKIDDTLEDDAGTYRFTTNALEQAPTGGGSAPTVEEIDAELSANHGAGAWGASVSSGDNLTVEITDTRAE
jgi:hypothetical protein